MNVSQNLEITDYSFFIYIFVLFEIVGTNKSCGTRPETLIMKLNGDNVYFMQILTPNKDCIIVYFSPN